MSHEDIISKLFDGGAKLQDIFDEAYNEVIYQGGIAEDFALTQAQREDLFKLFDETMHRCPSAAAAMVLHSAIAKLLEAHVNAISKIADLSSDEINELVAALIDLGTEEK